MESDNTPDEKQPETTDEAVPLNRAERRALAHKKKQANAGGSGMRGSNSTGAARPTGQAGNIRLPRTGHK